MNIARQQRHNILLITSNVGSLFEEKLQIRKYWLDQITKEVVHNNPIFFALHLQESGGKNYKLNSKQMPDLVEELRERLFQQGFIVSRCFLDIQYEIVEEYTALSSLCFVHASMVEHTWQYNFRERKWNSLSCCDVDGIGTGGGIVGRKMVLTSGLVRSGLVRKERFSRNFWPNFRFSRKGFLHTRWKIDDRIFDLINIHLFHDESNLNFLENPTQYSNNRRNALNYVLHKFEKFNGGTIEGNSNLFIFGDFNFRLNLGTLVKKLTHQTNEREILLSSIGQKGSAKTGGGTALMHSISRDSSGNASSSFGDGDDEFSEDSGASPGQSCDFSSPTAFASSSSSPNILLPPTIRSPISTEPSASSSETDDLRTSCDDFEDEILVASAGADDGGGHLSSGMRRKNSIIEYYKPVMREFLSPFDGPDGNVSWVLRIGKKRFEYHDAEWLLSEWRSYKEDDCEPREFPLHELPLEFPPTYPWSEESICYKHFMNTRAPAWCDRVLFNENASKLLLQQQQNQQQGSNTTANSYRSFGLDNCIGDHKPVLLLFSLPSKSNDERMNE